MAFSGINHVAILVAAVAAWLVGAAWYMSLGRLWTAAVGLTSQQMEEVRRRPTAYLPFLYVFIADLVMAWVLAGLLGHIGALTVRAGIISAAFCWAGFVLTTLVANYTFAMRSWRLILIDAGHWLVVLLVMGAIIGGWGVR